MYSYFTGHFDELLKKLNKNGAFRQYSGGKDMISSLFEAYMGETPAIPGQILGRRMASGAHNGGLSK
ncbi:MAG: hypothetical protein ACI97A_001254 [Planctomycetota bacterium]|jgi:hypothetical protein